MTGARAIDSIDAGIRSSDLDHCRRTGDSKKPSDFNGAFEFQVPLRIHEGFERYGFPVPNNRSISATSSSVLKLQSQELWRQRGRERPKRPWGGDRKSGALCGKARGSWAFQGPRLGPETVVSGGNGGGKGTGIQLSLSQRAQLHLPIRSAGWRSGRDAGPPPKSTPRTRTSPLRSATSRLQGAPAAAA